MLGILGLIAICITAAVTDTALQTSNQTRNFIQNWIKDAHTIWVTQVQTDEKVQDKIQELKTAIHPMGWRSINRFTKTSIIKLIGILLNFVSLLFGSTIVLTIQNKSNFICKIYMTMLPYMYNCSKRNSLKPSLRVYPLPTIWKP